VRAVLDACLSAALPVFAHKIDSALHPVLRVRLLVHQESSGAANKDVRSVRQIAADASAVPVAAHQFAGPNPERFPVQVRDYRLSALVSMESVGAAKCLPTCLPKYPALPQQVAHLAMLLPVDDSLAQFLLEAVEPSVALEARRSAVVPQAGAVQQELSLEMSGQSKLRDAVAR
jgi:hypothetical protein